MQIKTIDSKLQKYLTVNNKNVKLNTDSNVYWVDWNHGSVCVINELTSETFLVPNLNTLLDKIKNDTIKNVAIVLETSSESFNLANRNKFVIDSEEWGVELLTTPTRATSRWRNNHLPLLIEDDIDDLSLDLPFGNTVSLELSTKDYSNNKYSIVKSNANDVAIIRTLVLSGTALGKLKIHDAEDPWKQIETNASKTLMILRNTKLAKIGKLGQPLKSIESLKDRLANLLNDNYFDFESDYWTETDRIVLGNLKDRTFNSNILVAVSVAVANTNNRSEFTKLCGLYHLAHPNMFRSEIYFWGMGNPGGKKTRSRTWSELGITLTDYTRSLRKLRRYLIGNNVPVQSMIDRLLES